MAKLIIESGGAPREVSIGEICRIGRDKANEIQLDDAGASRRHCRIAREGDKYILEDLKSANGTQRNDQVVDRVVLEDGDVIRVGATTLRFTLSDAPGAPVDEIRLEQDPGPRAARFELVFVAGERSGERVRIAGDRVTMGRRGDSTVVLKDAKVSGVHAEVAIEGARVVLRDLGSTNGTFLEGKRIDEIPLDHGDRVTVGDNEFVLVDTSRPEPDLSDSGFDANRTIVDMPKVTVVRDVTRTPRRASPIFGVLAFVLVLAAAGWFWFMRVQQPAVVVDAPPASGNMLGRAWSFEALADAPDPADLWVAVGDHASFGVAAGVAHTGAQALVASPGEDAGAVALLRTALACTSRVYRIEAFARCEAGAGARVVALFTDDQGRQAGVPIGSAEGTDWTLIEGEVVPPSGAKQMQIELVGVGPGRVWFDDAGVFEGDMAKPATLSVSQFDFERTGPVLLARFGGEELLRFQGLAFVADDGVPWSVETWSSGRDAGRVRCGAGGARFASALDGDERSVTWKLEWSEASAGVAAVDVPLVLSGALVAEPVGVLRGDQMDPYEGSFEADAVTGFVMGKGGTRIRVRMDAPVAVVARRGVSDFTLRLRPQLATERVAFHVQVDFRDEKVRASELLAEARQAQGSSAYGNALLVLQRITNEFPFDEATLAEAARRRGEIQKIRDDMRRDLREKEERARFLRSPAAFDEAIARAHEGAGLFAGAEAGPEFAARVADLESARDEALKGTQRREADLLLGRMRTALAQDPPHELIADEIRDYLVARYPWSDAAQAAANENKD